MIAKAIMQGMQRVGEDAEQRSSQTYRGRPQSEIAIFYGLSGGLRNVLRDYRESGRRALFIDLGYWGRRKKTRWDGFHKIVLNARHPTAYFRDTPKPHDRFAQFSVPVQPWRTSGEPVIVIGMSQKAAAEEHYRAEEWERDTVQRLRKMTRRPIIYRPKPNWPGARPIPGTQLQRDIPIPDALVGAHAIVTHHSNVAVDAILAGIPAICPDGVASVISSHDLESIESPLLSRDRAQWAADLAYCQWNMAEMADGTAWRMLGQMGLLG